MCIKTRTGERGNGSHNQTRIAIAVKSIAAGERVFVGALHQFDARFATRRGAD